MSIGLMRAVSLQFMEMCIKSLYSTGTALPCSCNTHMLQCAAQAAIRRPKVGFSLNLCGRARFMHLE